ncbi:MAG: response regulator transcription factor [Rhodocyclaceae bacterium]|nr:response regulator transcription factor [Rhodocyclaceae bacterium]
MADIVVADPHPVVRIGLRQVLAVARDFHITGEAGHSTALFAELARSSCDLLVLEPALPELPAVELIGRVRRQSAPPRVLVFGVYREEDYALPVIELGAAGYLHKRSPPEQILVAVRTVLAGDTYLPPGVARSLLAGDGGGGGAAPHLALSRREMGVLLMLGAGRPLKRIAAEFNLSVKTVSTYRSRVLQKLGLASNADLTRYVIERDLV